MRTCVRDELGCSVQDICEHAVRHPSSVFVWLEMALLRQKSRSRVWPGVSAMALHEVLESWMEKEGTRDLGLLLQVPALRISHVSAPPWNGAWGWWLCCRTGGQGRDLEDRCQGEFFAAASRNLQGVRAFGPFMRLCPRARSCML